MVSGEQELTYVRPPTLPAVTRGPLSLELPEVSPLRYYLKFLLKKKVRGWILRFLVKESDDYFTI